jgi:hypothetical protein
VGLIKLLIWFFLAWLVISGIRKFMRGAARPSPRATPRSEEMVRCVSCGLNVPKAEAVAAEGGWACSAEHARVAHGGDSDRK